MMISPVFGQLVSTTPKSLQASTQPSSIGKDTVQFSGKGINELLKDALPTSMGVVPLPDKTTKYLQTFQLDFSTKKYVSRIQELQRGLAKQHVGADLILRSNSKSGANGWQWSCEVTKPDFKALKKNLTSKKVEAPEKNRNFVEHSITTDGTIFPEKQDYMAKYVIQALQAELGHNQSEYGFYDLKTENNDNGTVTYTWKRAEKPIDFKAIAGTNQRSGRDGSLSSRVHYRVESDFQLENADGYRIQSFGYHPEGYGFYGFQSVKNEETGKWISTWKRSGSCD